jgi:hypothetical protein
MVEHRFAQASVSLTCTVAPELPAILGDLTLLQHAATNLLLNAYQASGAGGHVGVSVTRDGDQVVVAIDDSGPGISPVDAQRAVQPFFATKLRKDGTGLGLWPSPTRSSPATAAPWRSRGPPPNERAPPSGSRPRRWGEATCTVSVQLASTPRRATLKAPSRALVRALLRDRPCNTGRQQMRSRPLIVADEDQRVPGEVTSFVHEHIDRLETLHVLLLLHATAPRAWSVREVSLERQSSAYSAEISLRQLQHAGLLTRDDDERFRFQPRTSQLLDQAAWLVWWYQARPSSVIALIFSSTRRPSM